MGKYLLDYLPCKFLETNLYFGQIHCANYAVNLFQGQWASLSLKSNFDFWNS